MLWLVLGYFAIAFGVWYGLFATTVMFDGGSSVFKEFFKQVFWYLPGGLKRLTDHIRNIVGDSHRMGSIGTTRRIWNFREIRDQNLYEECAKDALCGTASFWTTYFITPLFWPIAFIKSLTVAILRRIR